MLISGKIVVNKLIVSTVIIRNVTIRRDCNKALTPMLIGQFYLEREYILILLSV